MSVEDREKEREGGHSHPVCMQLSNDFQCSRILLMNLTIDWCAMWLWTRVRGYNVALYMNEERNIRATHSGYRCSILMSGVVCERYINRWIVLLSSEVVYDLFVFKGEMWPIRQKISHFHVIHVKMIRDSWCLRTLVLNVSI